MNKFNTPLDIRRKNEIKARRIQERKEAREQRKLKAIEKARKEAYLEYQKDPLGYYQKIVQNTVKQLEVAGKRFHDEFSPIYKKITKDISKFFGYDIDEIKRIEKEIREYGEKQKKSKYIGHIPERLFIYRKNQNGIEKAFKKHNKSPLWPGIREYGMWSGSPHKYGDGYPKGPNNSGPVNSSSGFNPNIQVNITPDFTPNFPKVAVGAMTGKPSEWCTKPLIEILQDEENKKKNLDYFKPRYRHTPKNSLKSKGNCKDWQRGG